MEEIKKSRERSGTTRSHSRYSESFKRHVARIYVESDQSLSKVARQFGVSKVDVSNWKKRFYSELAMEENIAVMPKEDQKELELLKRQNETLKKKLEYEQMRNFALETMVELAKTELGIDLRKNSGAKQPKK